MKNKLFAVIMFLVLWRNAHGQGFVNFNFEQAVVGVSPTQAIGAIDPAIAFPGWTVSAGAVWYNTETLGTPAVVLIGSNAVGFTPLQGSYSVLIENFYASTLSPATLSQTALVPVGAQSINFLADPNYNNAVVTLNAVNIPLVSISGGRLAGDISTFAGTVAQLTFSSTTNNISNDALYFDDIRFSSTAVPEPSEFALGALGALLLGFRRWKNSSR